MRILRWIGKRLVLILCWYVALVNSVQADTELIGYGVESSDPAYYGAAPLAAEGWKAFRIRAINSGIPDYLKVYLWNIDGNPVNEVGFAIYSDQNRHIGDIIAWGYLSYYNWSLIGENNYHEFLFDDVYEDIVSGNNYWLTLQASGGDNVFISRGRQEACPDAINRYVTNVNAIPCCENPPQANDFVNQLEPGCYGWQVYSSDTSRLRLTVLKAGDGSGTVSASGLNCQLSRCTGRYRLDTNVIITPHPTAPSLFSGWEGCDQVIAGECHVTMNRDITVTATFVKPAKVSVKPKSLKFGAVKKGVPSETKTIQVSNTGSSELIISGIQVDPVNGEFVSSQGCSTLGPGETCDIGVTVTPIEFGKRSSSLYLYTNDFRNQVVSVALKANAKHPKIKAIPKGLNFGQVIIGSEITKSIRIENRGLSDLTNLAVSAVNSEESFTINNTCPQTLRYLEGCEVVIAFRPTGEGRKTEALLITSPDPKKKTVTVNLSGKGNL